MIKGRKFKLSFWPLVITLTAFVILCKLGLWQLERAKEKQRLIAEQQVAVPLTEDGLLDKLQRNDISELNFRNTKFEAHFFREQQWLLDNKVFQGKVGYELVVPARVAVTEQVVLVSLGWWPAGSSRGELPKIELPPVLTVAGLIKASDFDTFTLGESQPQQGYPMRVQALSTIIEYSHPQSVIPIVVFAESNTIKGHPRLYTPVVMPPEKHQAYALQWFLLAFFSLVVFFAASLRKAT